MIKIEAMTATTSGRKLKVKLSDGRTVYVDSESAVKFHLDTSSEYTEEEFDEILCDSEYNMAKNRAFNILEYRAHTEKELFDKLCQKTDEDTATAVVEKMRDIGLVNDNALLKDKLENLLRVKKYGTVRVINELSLKGFDREEIKEAIEEMEYDEYSAVCEIIEKRYSDELAEGDIKARQRIVAALMRRGFCYDDIKSAISEYI